MKNKIKNFLLNAHKKESVLTYFLLTLTLSYFTCIHLPAHGAEKNGFTFSMALGAAYIDNAFPAPPSGQDTATNSGAIVFNDYPEYRNFIPVISNKKFGYKLSLAFGYSHLLWGLRPEVEAAIVTNIGLGDETTCWHPESGDKSGFPYPGKSDYVAGKCYGKKSLTKALTVYYVAANFIFDIPLKHQKDAVGSGTFPYVGLGFGTGGCNAAPGGDPPGTHHPRPEFKPYRDTSKNDCSGALIQGIVGMRSRWDSYFSSIIDMRVTKIGKLTLVSLNLGIMQQFE